MSGEAGRERGEADLHVLDFSDVERLAREGYTAIPLVERFDQRETAGALYERLRGNGPSFLLESAEPDERQGRYSFMGVNPDKIIRIDGGQMTINGEPQEFDDPYTFVDELITHKNVAPIPDLPPMFGGAVGIFGYDLARYREPTIGPPKKDELGLPTMALMVPRVTIAVDQYTQEVSIIRTIEVDDSQPLEDVYAKAVAALQECKQQIQNTDDVQPTPEPYYEPQTFTPNMPPEQYKAAVQKARDYAEVGDAFQVVPSQRFSSDGTVDSNFANAFFHKLKRLNPSRYAFLLEFEDFQVAGCSPETLVKVTDGHVEHMAIAGTRKRGKTPEEDEILAADLLADKKELAEHGMLVDLSRNDVNRVCTPESVDVTTHAVVEPYSHVLHLTSEVEGDLREGYSALDALASIAPAGTLSGAPKIRAMQIIDELENDARGPYGGAVGYVNPKGDIATCIFIRSIVVDQYGRIHVQAGAGVVADSDPESELQETYIKAAAPLAAVDAVCNPKPYEQVVDEVPTQYSERLARPKISRRRVHETGRRVLMIDNYDSYTYNVAQYLALLGADITVMRNDVSFRELTAVKPDFLVVSPGPRGPEDAGHSIEALRYFPEEGIPSLGICLGHQALAMAFDGEVDRHKAVHGKASKIIHDGRTVFSGLEDPEELRVQRYHSLVVRSLPDELEPSAHVLEDGQKILMAIRHKRLPVEGLQFHPESFYTPEGKRMLQNFLDRAE